MLVVVGSALLSECVATRDPVVALSVKPSFGYSPLLVHLEAQVLDTASMPLSCKWKYGDDTSAVVAITDHEPVGCDHKSSPPDDSPQHTLL